MPVHEGYLIVLSDGPNTCHPGAYAKVGSLFGPSSNDIPKTSISALSATPYPPHSQWRGHLQLQTALPYFHQNLTPTLFILCHVIAPRKKNYESPISRAPVAFK